MAGFKAASAVDPFDYDFAPYADAKGVVPEPSDETVRGFYVGLGNALKNALGDERTAGIDLSDPAELRKLQSAMTEDDMAKMQEAMLELHASVCGGSPSLEQIEKLPYRLKQAFYGALQRWLSPEASRPAGKS